MFNQEQKYTGIITMPYVNVFVGNKNILSRTFNVTQKQLTGLDMR